MPRILRSLPLLLAVTASASSAEPTRVVASLLPVHSLVSAVMEGVAEPLLLLPGSASPHDYALRPSDARALRQATLVFRIGPGMEGFLDKPLASLATAARVVDLVEAPGVMLLQNRRNHDSASPGDTDGSASTAQTAPSGEHLHGRSDSHVWLSPANAAAMVVAIGAELSHIDTANADRYAFNTRHTLQRLQEHEQRWRERLGPLRARPFVVYHDAYRYLEHHFGLHSIGAVLSSPERQPSAMHLRALLDWMRVTGVRCLFREPQFASPLVDMVLQDSGATASNLDPLGAGLAPGADAWFQLMDANVDSLASCLSR